MGPEVAAIAFAAAATSAGGLSFLGESMAASTQRKLDNAAIEVNQERFRLQAAESSLANATNFRKALASQVALASLRGGSGSVARQFGSESYSNFLQDQESIKRGVRLADIQAMQQRAQAKANQAATTTKSFGSFAQSSISAWNMAAGSGASGGGGK